MQYKKKEYNPKEHDAYKALTIKQPYADAVVTPAYKDEDGQVYAEKRIEVRSRATKFRGELLICSSAKPSFPGLESGCTLGFVELYDIKPVADFTKDDWEATRIPVEKRGKFNKGYGWLLRNPRRCVEVPVKGQLGIYDIIYTKGCIIEYPRNCTIDKKGWEMIQKQLKK